MLSPEWSIPNCCEKYFDSNDSHGLAGRMIVRLNPNLLICCFNKATLAGQIRIYYLLMFLLLSSKLLLVHSRIWPNPSKDRWWNPSPWPPDLCCSNSHLLLVSLDWTLQERPIFHGKIFGFRFRFSQQNQSIESWNKLKNHGLPAHS